MRPYATGSVSLGSAEEPYDSDMTHSYRLTEGRLIRYPMQHIRVNGHSMGWGRLVREVEDRGSPQWAMARRSG